MRFSAVSAILFTLAIPAIARPFPQHDSVALQDDSATITARDISNTDGNDALFQVTRRDDVHMAESDSADFGDSALDRRGVVKAGGRRGPKVLDQKNKEGKVDVSYVENHPASSKGAKDMIKDDYKKDTGKDPSTINKVKFTDGYNPQAAEAQKKAMEKARKTSGTHVFTPGSPGFDELKNSPLYKLGNKVQAGKGDPQRVKIKDMDGTGGADVSMDWRTPEQRAADKAKKAANKAGGKRK